MSPRKKEIQGDEELAAYLEKHKDEGDWEEVELERPTKVSSVYSIRFTGQELDALHDVALRQGRRISQIVRDAVSLYLARQRQQQHFTNVDFKRAQYISFTANGLTTAEPTRAVTPPRLKVIWGEARPGPDSLNA